MRNALFAAMFASTALIAGTSLAATFKTSTNFKGLVEITTVDHVGAPNGASQWSLVRPDKIDIKVSDLKGTFGGAPELTLYMGQSVNNGSNQNKTQNMLVKLTQVGSENGAPAYAGTVEKNPIVWSGTAGAEVNRKVAITNGDGKNPNATWISNYSKNIALEPLVIPLK